MGSEFWSIDQAAEKLKCSRRSVYHYIRKGYLRQQEYGIPKEEVEQLVKDRASDAPPINGHTLLKMQRDIRKLQEENAVFRKILDIHEEPLLVSKELASQIHLHCVASLKAKKWVPEEIEKWCLIFNGLDESSLDIMKEAVESDMAWEPFLVLCLAQLRYVSSAPDFKTNLILQSLYQKLQAALGKMRQVTVVWLELNKGSVNTGIRLHFKEEKDDLFKRLYGNRAKKAGTWG